MVMKQDFSAPRKKALTTYGKAPRKRQPKTTFTPPAFPPIPEDDDSTSKRKATVAHRRPSLLTSPLRKPSSPSTSLDRKIDAKVNTASLLENGQSSDRKRKISQVYSSKGRTQEHPQPDQAPILPNHVPHRSRLSTSTNSHQTVRPIARQRTFSASSEQMVAEPTEARLSSPPPTPTLPRALGRPKTLAAKGSTSSAPGANAAGKEKQGSIQQQIPLRLGRESLKKPKPLVPSSNGVDEEVRSAIQSAPDGASKKRRKRLIDALVEQSRDEEADEIDESNEAIEDLENPSLPTLSHQVSSDISMLDSQPLPQTPNRIVSTAQLTATRTFARSTSALKFTYGQNRKVLEEEGDLLESLTFPELSAPLKGRRLELGTPKKNTSTRGVLDEDDPSITGSPNSKLRDIHELKQAGANSRVADTMQDLADQIGSPSEKPSSSRRAALLQVAEKIKDKTFMRQCRDFGAEAALFKDMGKESDTISGYLISAILATILAKWPSTHTQQLVRLGAPANMFAHLLGTSRDIKLIARDRKSNLSKRSQTSLIAVQSMLCGLSVWDKASPSCISPRSLALKCLHLLVTQDVNIIGDPSIISPAVIKGLFAVLSEAAESTKSWDYPAASEAIDLVHALSILNFYAMNIAVSRRGNTDWAAQYLPTVADVFKTLQTVEPDTKAQETETRLLEGSVLRLIINITNNNLEAPEIFVSKGLIPALAGSITSNFAQVWASLSQDAWVDGILDGLVLRLGIMINFSEHSSLVRHVIDECKHDDQRPVEELIRLFLENYRRTAEADSVETSQLNVAFGYLSVLLGYLALYPPVRQKIRSAHKAKSIGPLLDSLREFITHHKKVESQNGEEDDEDPQDHHGYTERLQDLVRQLEEQAARD
ncbi:uncharacterized protein F4822DRAFT_175815 [Hypoxylon trugodes]|uniref:uncharacterized protein n=1 Tax=Hypoxylon trugodes TaxID=326681 RepID=UPI00218FF32B|nr:uncharacterized protein F4822DRAFT_175815 [Hypoxylon trugodes]KAI1391145.1 hypothetical protein F4822DRAFT_175815 [Hypoxylon trugodes]